MGRKKKMSSEAFVDDDEYQDEDEESYEDEWEGESDSEEEETTETPPFLEGNLMVDTAHPGTITYTQDGSFCLKSQNEIPSTWSLRSPSLSSVRFGGWIHDASVWVDFDIKISEQDVVDPLDEKLLKAQQERYSEPETIKVKNDNPDETVKAQDHEKKSASLKSPPSYSLKQSPSSEGKKQVPKSTKSYNVAYTFVGYQVDSETGKNLKLRGIFYPPIDNSEKLFLICSVTTVEGSPKVASLATATVASATATAAKRKRLDDDDSGDDNDGVDCQELIDLYDEAGLSTDELRRRYYKTSSSNDDVSSKRPATDKRTKPSEGDDRDDAEYGF